MRPKNEHGFPTILVAGSSRECDKMFRLLQQAGYLVLVARDGAEAILIAKTHSRPIELLLVDGTTTSGAFIGELPPYQPGIRVLTMPVFTESSVVLVRDMLEHGLPTETKKALDVFPGGGMLAIRDKS